MIKAKKKFGQNFLIDASILQQIFQATPKVKKIVEVGGGLGDLTQWLLRTGAKVRCYEIDFELFELLRRKFAGEIAAGGLELVCADVLERWEELDEDGDFSGRGANSNLSGAKNADKESGADSGEKIADSERGDNGEVGDFGGVNAAKIAALTTPATPAATFALVANLPYYVATNIILKALQDARCTHLLVMTQLEVAQKFAAKAGEREFCALSVLAQSVARARLLFAVPASAFNPPPKVISAVIEFVKGEQDLARDDGFWAEFGAGFDGEFDGAMLGFGGDFAKAQPNATPRNPAQNAHAAQTSAQTAQAPTPATHAQNAQIRAARQRALQSVVCDKGFHDFLRAAFSAPRKKLLKNLSLSAHPLIPSNARPHELCAEFYLKLFKGLQWKMSHQNQTKNDALGGTSQT